jgi:hypothetical protein
VGLSHAKAELSSVSVAIKTQKIISKLLNGELIQVKGFRIEHETILEMLTLQKCVDSKEPSRKL